MYHMKDILDDRDKDIIELAGDELLKAEQA